MSASGFYMQNGHVLQAVHTHPVACIKSSQLCIVQERAVQDTRASVQEAQ